MSDDRRHDENLPLGEDATMALEALVRLPRAQAPDAAREQARAVFLRGEGTEGVEGAESSRVVPMPPRRKSRPRWAALMMAAALGVLAVVWFGTLPTEQWVVLDVVNPGGIAGVEAAPAVGSRLDGGQIATGPESELELQLGDQLRFRMVPGTDLELPRAPGRWFGRGRRLELEAGEIYGTSGGRQLDFELTFATEELQAELIGTTFAVFRTADASCVCLWEGGIVVSPLVGTSDPIALQEKRRVWIYRDARAPEILPLSDMEVMKLQMIHDSGLAESPQ